MSVNNLGRLPHTVAPSPLAIKRSVVPRRRGVQLAGGGEVVWVEKRLQRGNYSPTSRTRLTTFSRCVLLPMIPPHDAASPARALNNASNCTSPTL